MQVVEQLEKALTEWNGCAMPHIVACSSGTAALHLALEALRAHGFTQPFTSASRKIGRGSEVLLSDYNMIACPRAITMAGMIPRFIDCGPDLNINPKLIEKEITLSTVAIMVTHIYGRRCSMETIANIATKHGLSIIEDMAELHGVAPHPLTTAVCWSFYKNKIVHGEEGGAVGFRSPMLASAARTRRCLGFTDQHDFYHHERGYNYRLADSLARLIIQSLDQSANSLLERRLIEEWLDKSCPEEWKMPARQSPWVYDLRIPCLQTNDGQYIYRIIENLQRNEIPARHGFKRMTAQAEYNEPGRGMSEASKAGKEVFYLPIHSEMRKNKLYNLSSTAAPIFDLIRSLLR